MVRTQNEKMAAVATTEKPREKRVWVAPRIESRVSVRTVTLQGNMFSGGSGTSLIP